jgi:precorrin-2 dehydrogenase/sirohydrochlorin ferrochelatase
MKKSENSIFFPILLNLQKFPCLVVGGGEVALRKVQSLLLFNAKITLISPKICKPLKELKNKKKIKIVLKSYSKEHIKNHKIIFCATDNRLLNKQIHKDCKREGILLNVADNPSLCDFILPANVKRGALTISISSQGTAPFMVKELKKKSELTFSPAYNEIMELAGDFRKKLLSDEKFKTHRNRTKAFNKFIMTDWELMLANEGKKNSYKYMQGILNNFN